MSGCTIQSTLNWMPTWVPVNLRSGNHRNYPIETCRIVILSCPIWRILCVTVWTAISVYIGLAVSGNIVCELSECYIGVYRTHMYIWESLLHLSLWTLGFKELTKFPRSLRAVDIALRLIPVASSRLLLFIRQESCLSARSVRIRARIQQWKRVQSAD